MRISYWQLKMKSQRSSGSHIYRVGQNKPDCFSELITLRRLVVERRVVRQKFSNFVLKNCKTYMSVSLNIFCLIA